MARKYAVKYNFTANLVQSDAGSLPYNDVSFNFAIAVAIYHHIEGESQRRHALRELHRVLKPGGEAFITVWNRGQPRFWFRGKDIRVPWRTGEETFYRYYHLFTYGELKKLVRKAGFEIIESFPEKAYRFPVKHFSKNVCLLVRKTADD